MIDLEQYPPSSAEIQEGVLTGARELKLEISSGQDRSIVICDKGEPQELS